MKMFIIISISVILLLVLGACDGDEAASTESDAPAETETATPSPEPETEEEAPVEEPTPEPAPTVVETEEEESPSGDEEPMEETESAGEEVASSGNGWGESGSEAQSACDHPYMPMRTGSTWTYDDGENMLIWEVTDVQGDLESATAMMQVTISDVTIDYIWNCMAGEGMASFDFANLGIRPGGVELTIEQQSAEGVFLLPAEQMVPGESWVMKTEGTFTFMQEAADSEMEVTGDITNEQQQTIISADPITFEDQTVDGIQIEQINTIIMIMNILGTATEQTFSASSTYDLGRGIGMLNQAYSTDFGDEGLEMLSYYIP